jgi:hypothetical protein
VVAPALVLVSEESGCGRCDFVNAHTIEFAPSPKFPLLW